MKTINVSEATDTQLDWLVAKCEGFRPVYTNEWVTPRHPEDPKRVCVSVGTTGRPFLTPYEPSSSWMQMGPIIAREGIDIFTSYEGSRIEGSFAEQTGWAARRHTHGGPINPKRFLGPTPLIAAARCYVASKLGEAAEVPEELA